VDVIYVNRMRTIGDKQFVVQLFEKVKVLFSLLLFWVDAIFGWLCWLKCLTVSGISWLGLFWKRSVKCLLLYCFVFSWYVIFDIIIIMLFVSHTCYCSIVYHMCYKNYGISVYLTCKKSHCGSSFRVILVWLLWLLDFVWYLILNIDVSIKC